MEIILRKSDKPKKKFMVDVDGKRVHFGASGYDDFTKTKDEDQKKRYLARHKKREDWTKSGIKTSGFWSRWLLWNKKTLKESIEDIEKRFNIKINPFKPF